jgi:hypothetical protein
MCGAQEDKKCIQNSGGGADLKEKGHLHDLSVDGNITVAPKTGWQGTDRAHQSRDRNKCWDFVGTAMKLLGSHIIQVIYWATQ